MNIISSHIALGLILVTLCIRPAAAQPAIDAHVTLSGLVSIQPEGYDGTGGPYLDHSLGGTEPGFGIALDLSGPRWTLLAIELTTTTAMQVLQSGRFVIGRSFRRCDIR